MHRQDLGKPLGEEKDEVFALQLVCRCQLHQVGQQPRRLLLGPELPYLELSLDLLEVGEAVVVEKPVL